MRNDAKKLRFNAKKQRFNAKKLIFHGTQNPRHPKFGLPAFTRFFTGAGFGHATLSEAVV